MIKLSVQSKMHWTRLFSLHFDLSIRFRARKVTRNIEKQESKWLMVTNCCRLPGVERSSHPERDIVAIDAGEPPDV